MTRQVMNLSKPGPTASGIPRCRYCKKPLRKGYLGRYGYDGKGNFCSLRCAHVWALEVIHLVETEGVVVVPEELGGTLEDDGSIRIEPR